VHSTAQHSRGMQSEGLGGVPNCATRLLAALLCAWIDLWCSRLGQRLRQQQQMQGPTTVVCGMQLSG
jgi:hypothetical protein